ncbi:collagen alpha-1(II) chain-like isoform X3 [Emydura macquarii macquarii]|uniref:collagen alpha-1(II) chain-like isoform X3 n=1 Tax=Emydura macquarii macquarii TaxID=1129001 RepID=UPI00352A15DE
MGARGGLFRAEAAAPASHSRRRDAAQGGEVSADRPALAGHRPAGGREAGGRRAAAGPGAAAARAPPARLRDLRRLQAGEHAALLEPARDGGRGRDLLPGLAGRAGDADPGQGGAPGGAAGGLDAPLPQAARRLPHPVPGTQDAVCRDEQCQYKEKLKML